MKRNHYLVQADDLAELAEDFLYKVSEAVDARNNFADSFKAAGVKIFQSISVDEMGPTIISVTGLRFLSKIPNGFAISETHGGYAVPDITTDLGRSIAVEMAALPSIPLASAIASRIEYGSALRVLPDGGATAISVEKIDDSLVINVPVFAAEEIERHPHLAWTPPSSGMTLISESQYKEMKEVALEYVSRSSMRPAM